MSGINRAHSLKKSEADVNLSLGKKCIFISHHKSDLDYCKRIAHYIMNAGIDVYLDEYDYDLKEQVQQNNPAGVVGCIKKGINKSTHMLCVISKDTIYSKWVPWEIGYGYDKTNVGALTLKGISDYSLPDYLKTVTLIRGTKSLNEYISKVSNYSEDFLESYNYIKKNNTIGHSLDDVLDWRI